MVFSQLKNIMKLVAIFVFTAKVLFAQSETQREWINESELSVVTASGNNESETYSTKHKTVYNINLSNSLTFLGGYISGKSTQTDNKTGIISNSELKKWNTSLRYDTLISKDVGVFVSHGAESDSNVGYIQRDNTDVGGKFFIIKNEDNSLSSEVGYRYTKNYENSGISYLNFARLYLEYLQTLSASTSIKFWVEHLPNLKMSENYYTNAELSASIVLNSLFSLKTAYLVKYQNVPVTFTNEVTNITTEGKHLDSLFTTALVAKF